jgi:signal transduction histidine kinase
VILAQRLIPFSFTLSVCVNCLFGRQSVSIGRLPSWVKGALDVLIPLTALCAVLAPIVPFSVVPFLLAFCYLGLIPFAAVVVLSWRLQRGAAREMVSTGWANALLMGWLAVLVGVVVTGLSVSGHLPSNAFTVHGFMFGASLQFVLMTAGLSYRLEWLQAELAKVNVQLQGKIGDLNAAIDLTQTEATRAAAAARAKGEVVATMTHELRTPLNAIINIPQGLQHDFGETPCARCTACNASFVFDDGEHPELPVACPSCGRSDALAATTLLAYVGDPMRSIRYLEIVEKAGHHLLRVVQRILDPATENGDLQIAPLDVIPVLSEVADQMNAVATQAGVELRVDVASSSLWLAADPLRLRQILINLIGNAIKFSDGKGVVTVRARSDEGSAVFSVQDDGIGIAEDKRAGIFESFEQAHDPALRRFGGTGLGLSIVRSLVSLHGGEIWLESKLGHGTTFYFTIPLAVGGSRQLDAQAS